MVLHRAKKTTLQDFSKLGIAQDYAKQINRLIDLAKGRIDHQVGGWFYSLFLGRQEPYAPKTTEEVQQLLERAWWIEEDDLRQEIAIYIYKNGINIKARLLLSYELWLAISFKIIAIQVKQYIIGAGGQLFSKKRSIDFYDYKIYLDNIAEHNRLLKNNISFSILTTDKLSLSNFHRYLLYLQYAVEYDIDELKRVLDIGNFLYRSIFYRLGIKIREINNGITTEDTG